MGNRLHKQILLQLNLNKGVFMALFSGILSGKKTYVIAVTAALTAIGSYLYGGIDITQLVQALFAAAAAASIKSAIAKIE